jgi:hypothetical protein
VEHHFRYRLFMMYIDLDEAPSLFSGRWFWAVGRRALAWLRREDHLGDPARPLGEAVRDLVEERTGRRPQRPLTGVRATLFGGACLVSGALLVGLGGPWFLAVVLMITGLLLSLRRGD